IVFWNAQPPMATNTKSITGLPKYRAWLSMAHSEVNDAKLVLVIIGTRTITTCDWVTRADGVVGRIFRHPQALENQPWHWTITAREQPPGGYGRNTQT
ncbi:MAG: hypothetical protein WA697_18375, partial [Pseudolabrys sp.]